MDKRNVAMTFIRDQNKSCKFITHSDVNKSIRQKNNIDWFAASQFVTNLDIN